MPRRQPHAHPCRVRQRRQGIRDEAAGDGHLRTGFRSEKIGAQEAAMTVREAPAGAAGVNGRRYRLLAFVIGAFYAGCAGSLAAHVAPELIHPDDYIVPRVVAGILMVVEGGLGRIWGGVIGAALITLIAEWSRA